jgi:hypothetical protein
VPIFGQSLRLSSATATQGERITLAISLRSPHGQEPTALQWEASIPADQLSFVDEQLPLGPAAQAAGKFVACAVKLLRAATGDTYTSKCILAGGLEPVQDGQVAVLRLQVSPKASGSVEIAVKGMAVFKDLKQVPLNTINTVVVVHAKKD